jgi:hypothetical protein
MIQVRVGKKYYILLHKPCHTENQAEIRLYLYSGTSVSLQAALGIDIFQESRSTSKRKQSKYRGSLLVVVELVKTPRLKRS